MKTVGIIAEYNPFHNGHAYQLAKAKQVTGADYCIVVMSGDFVQRGAPAITDKYIRAESALRCGADLVLELPVYYSLGSAEYFASASIALLEKIGVTDTVCFGSECGDMTLLSEFAERLSHEDDLFKEILKRQLKSGMSYPNARNAALETCAPHLNAHMHILSNPNNILGIEYCKALLRRKSAIKPYTIRRAGASYHDASLESAFCSALAIREALAGGSSLCDVQNLMPESAFELLHAQYGRSYPVFPDDVSMLLHYQLLSGQADGYTDHPDIDPALSDRIIRKLPAYRSYSDFCEQLKTKNRTYTRIARCLMHILLQTKQEDLIRFCSEDYIYYARMLGFRKSAEPLLTAIKTQSSIPLLSKLAASESLLSDSGRRMLASDIYASHVYQCLVQHKFSGSSGKESAFESEYQRQMLRI